MNRSPFPSLIVGAALGAAAVPLLASMCCEVIDRNDVVICRATRPPVDLSNAGAPAREAMRNRGELLIIFDATNCVVLGRATTTGSRALSAEAIVGEWRSFAGKGAWFTYSSHYGGSPTPVQPATQADSPDLSTPSGSR